LGTNYTECSSVGIDDFNFDIQIDIFPNPMTDLLNISGLKNNSEITIIDLSGKLIRRFLVHQSRITINASDLNNGFYVLKVTDAQNTFTQKFLKFRESIY
jgi:hypothetical protein